MRRKGEISTRLYGLTCSNPSSHQWTHTHRVSEPAAALAKYTHTNMYISFNSTKGQTQFQPKRPVHFELLFAHPQNYNRFGPDLVPSHICIRHKLHEWCIWFAHADAATAVAVDNTLRHIHWGGGHYVDVGRDSIRVISPICVGFRYPQTIVHNVGLQGREHAIGAGRQTKREREK